jgi:hypothetical protein
VAADLHTTTTTEVSAELRRTYTTNDGIIFNMTEGVLFISTLSYLKSSQYTINCNKGFFSFVSDINEDILGIEDSPISHQSPEVDRVKRDVGGKMELHFTTNMR